MHCRSGRFDHPLSPSVNMHSPIMQHPVPHPTHTANNAGIRIWLVKRCVAVVDVVACPVILGFYVECMANICALWMVPASNNKIWICARNLSSYCSFLFIIIIIFFPLSTNKLGCILIEQQSNKSKKKIKTVVATKSAWHFGLLEGLWYFTFQILLNSMCLRTIRRGYIGRVVNVRAVVVVGCN